MSRRRYTMMVGMALAGSLLWSGCTSSSPAPASSVPAPAAAPAAAPATGTAPAAAVTAAPAARAPKRGGTVILNAGSNKPPTFDPILDGRSGLMNSGPGIVYSSLVRSKSTPDLPAGGSMVVCDLCESWKQDDPVTYTFTLRKGVLFTKSVGSALSDFAGANGRELTAEDVVYSIQAMKQPEGANRHLVVEIQSAEAVDRHTVKLTLQAPNADFMEGIATVAVPVVAKEIAAAKGNFKEGPSVGSGPWVLKSGDRTSGFKYVKNPDYYIKGADGQSLPYLDGIDQLPFLDNAAEIAAFRSGKLLWLALQKPQYDSISKEYPNWTYEFVKTTGSSNVLHLNKNIAPFTNMDFRKAIFYAYDPTEIVKVANNGQGYFFGGFSWPVDWAEEIEPQMKQYVGNLEKAKEYLAKSGVKTPIDIEFWVANYGETYVTGAQVLQDQLKRIGVNTTLKLHDQAEYQASHNRGEWDFQIGWGPNGTNGTNPWYALHALSSGLRAKASHINDPELDRMIKAQWGETDAKKRKAMNFEIAHYMAKNAIWDPATSTINVRAIRPEIHDLRMPSTGYETRYLIDAWID